MLVQYIELIQFYTHLRVCVYLVLCNFISCVILCNHHHNQDPVLELTDIYRTFLYR